MLGFAAHHLEVPGLYYDEVIQATPASEFLREGGRPLQIPGARNTWLFGGWFPVMTQAYMGALKSQALIPAFAAFGATRETLRLTTLLWSLAGLMLAMLWAREVLGLPVALLAGALVALDPSFVWVSRHDWGSFALGFLCRGGGLALVTSGWRRPSRARLAAGGLLLGLGLYNKIDFAVFLAAAGLALLIAAPRTVGAALGRCRDRLLCVAAGLALGAAPLLVALRGALSATRALLSGPSAGVCGWSEKLHTLAVTLDGSYFQRLMLAGGSFERLPQADAAGSPFLAVFLLSELALGARVLRAARAGRPLRAETFVLVTAIVTALGLLLTPRAARVHHALNLYPFPQLVVASVAVALWRARERSISLVARGLAVAGVAAALAGSLVVNARTLDTIRASGGKGRWSGAVEALAAELDGVPGAAAVSLDWGFHAQLRFTKPELELEEPIWALRRQRLGVGPIWSRDGTPQHLYLVQLPEYEVFDAGTSFLEAVRRLPMGSALIRTHEDSAGDPAFLSVRFARPHQLVYRRG
ncbi:MAG: hypothetical protein V3U03_16190, partial [Myxococcota bacterium]